MKIGFLEPWQLQEGCGSEALGFSFRLKYPRVGAGKVSNQEIPMEPGRSPKKSQKDQEKGGSVSLARKETFGHNCSTSAKQHRKSCSFTPTSISKGPAGKPHTSTLTRCSRPLAFCQGCVRRLLSPRSISAGRMENLRPSSRGREISPPLRDRMVSEEINREPGF